MEDTNLNEDTENPALTSASPIEAPTVNVRIRLADIRSNKQFLRVAAILFGLFVLSEIVGAIASNSLSLLGDAAAMSVDVATYLANMYTENLKKKYGKLSFLWRWILDVYIPTFAVASLLAVSFWIFSDAILVLLYPPENSTVDIAFLYGYASANMVIDIICNYYFFSRGMGAFYNAFEDVEKVESVPSDSDNDFVLNRNASDSSRADERISSAVNVGRKDTSEDLISSVMIHDQPTADLATINNSSATSLNNNDDLSLESLENLGVETEDMKSYNLNMWSAFTHMSGDTLRTISVLLAAFTATYSSTSGDICDAWASVICTISILSIALPLIWHIFKTGRSLQAEQQQCSRATVYEENLSDSF